MEILPEEMLFWIYLQKLQIAQCLESQNGMVPGLSFSYLWFFVHHSTLQSVNITQHGILKKTERQASTSLASTVCGTSRSRGTLCKERHIPALPGTLSCIDPII